MDDFKALVVTEENGYYLSGVERRELKDLPPGDVLIRVSYSSINYKDALSANGNKGVTRSFPHTPGIDAAGVVESSSSPNFSKGDEVIVTGYDLGMNTWGGLSEFIRVPAGWVVNKPSGLSCRQAMVLGTAGFTAAMCVDTLLQVGIAPSQGPVLVTGATGGVGAIAVWLLSNLGFEVTASTGKLASTPWLTALGATSVINRDTISEPTKKPMLKTEWAAVVDTVGGDTLSNALKAVQYGGSVACCGMAASAELSTSVFPFIIRGINLMGIDSVELPLDVKIDTWRMLAGEWNFKEAGILEALLCKPITLYGVPDALETVLDGKHQGRYLVSMTG